MMTYFIHSLTLLALLTSTIAQAIILDEEDKLPRKQFVKPKSPKPSQVISRVPNIEMVNLPTGINMGKYEITQSQWQDVMGDDSSHEINCGNCAVGGVSWDDAQQFLTRLNRQTKKHFRLPTEDECYTACQAGSSRTEYCGSDNLDDVAWSEKNTPYGSSPTVGQKHPNEWGLYDMSGNVWEWTDSCYQMDCTQRIFRGGSKDSSIRDHLKATFRNWKSTRSLPGFRITYRPRSIT